MKYTCVRKCQIRTAEGRPVLIRIGQVVESDVDLGVNFIATPEELVKRKKKTITQKVKDVVKKKAPAKKRATKKTTKKD